MSGLAGQALGIADEQLTAIAEDRAIDAESRGSMEPFIGFAVGASVYDPTPVDFDVADDTVTAGSDGTTRISPVYDGNELSWGGSPAPVFDPTELFSGGEQGAWFDPSDLSTMFQDVAGTVPVTAIGQPVGLILDKSGNGNNANCVAVTLAEVGGYLGLSFNGLGSSATTPAVTLNSAGLTLWAVTDSASTANQSIVSNGVVTSTVGTFDLQVGTLYRHGAGAWGARSVPAVITDLQVITAMCDLSGTTQDTENPLLTLNGTQLNFTNYGSGDTGGGTFIPAPIVAGNGLNRLNGHLFQLIVRGSLSTGDEIGNANAYCGAKVGIDIPVPHGDITQFQDTGTIVDKAAYLQTSAYAHADFTTQATIVEVTGYSNISSYFASYADIGVFIGTTLTEEITASANGSFSGVATLPPGQKTISIVNGLQSSPTNSLDAIVGTFLTSMASNAPLTQVFPTPVDRLVIYGDSIAVGGNSNVPLNEAWGNLLRNYRVGKSTAFEAFGYRSMYLDCSTAPKIDAFVAKIQAYNAKTLWMAIGTNDFGLTTTNAAGFNTMYGSVLDAIHLAMPSLVVYCQTMILRTPVDSLNGNGQTIQEYRDAMTAAITARPWAILVDGLPFVASGDLADGTHPTTAGHLTYFNNVKSVLGI